MHYIGIDIGTSTISGVVYNYATKEIESVTRPNDSTMQSTCSWEKIQQPQRIMELVLEVLNQFTAQYPNISGIGVTGQMHGILYIDNNGNALSPLYTWQDGRGNQLFQGNQTYATRISTVSDYELATGYGLVTHFYNQANHLVPSKTAKLCTIMDYVVMKLSSRTTPLTDYSNGASLGIFNTASLHFDQPALERVGIDAALLPELGESAACCGFFRNSIPVYSAIGDNQAAFLGSVSDIHRSIHITVGTSSQLSVYSDHYVQIPSLDTRPFPGGGYLLVGAALCGGQAFVLLKTFFEDTLKMFLGELPVNIDMYQTMSDVIYKSDSTSLPLVETLFDGTRSEPQQTGRITNITLANFTPDNLVVGFLKGISRELHTFYQRMPEEVRKGKDLLVGSGNALKKNPLLCHALEEQFSCKPSFSRYQEEAALGAALCAVNGEKKVSVTPSLNKA